MTLEELRKFKPQIEAIARRYHASDIRITGSVARGEATEKSDIDFIVCFNEPISLFEKFHMRHELEDMLHVRVDLLAEDTIKPRYKPYLMQDATTL